MKNYNDFKYSDMDDDNKIIITEGLLYKIKQYFLRNYNPFQIDYNVEPLNLEIFLKCVDEKINLFIEKTDEDFGMITYFSEEERLLSFEIMYVSNLGFRLVDIPYCSNKIEKYRLQMEDIIVFGLEWYPAILFYVQSNSASEDKKIQKYTFFINTPDFKLDAYE